MKSLATRLFKIAGTESVIFAAKEKGSITVVIEPLYDETEGAYIPLFTFS